MKHLIQPFSPAAMRRMAIGAAARLGRAVLRRPQLKMLARSVLMRFPALRTRVQSMMYGATNSTHRLSNRVQDDADLSPRTVRMLRALKHAAARHQQR